MNILGLTVPSEAGVFFSGCSFSLEIVKIGSKIGLFYVSGAPIVITKKEVETYNFSDCKI